MPTVRQNAAREIQLSGAPMANSVAQLTTHQARGIPNKTDALLPCTSDNSPSVANTVGSGRIPKASAARIVRPDAIATRGWKINAYKKSPTPTEVEIDRVVSKRKRPWTSPSQTSSNAWKTNSGAA